MARVNVAKSVLLDPHARAANDASRRGANLSVHQLHPGPTTRKRSERFDYGTAIVLVVVAPLVLGLLVYLLSGVEVAIRPLPPLLCC
jgi:hypothetical protein